MEKLTTETFKEKIFNYETAAHDENNMLVWKFEGSKPSVVEFMIDCEPVKIFQPVIEAFEKENENKVDVYQLDAMENQDLCNVFGIQAVPTIILIPLNNPPQLIGGAVPKEEFDKLTEKILW
jgi:thioredoxin-like negative regulator of GroEL